MLGHRSPMKHSDRSLFKSRSSPPAAGGENKIPVGVENLDRGAVMKPLASASCTVAVITPEKAISRHTVKRDG